MAVRAGVKELHEFLVALCKNLSEAIEDNAIPCDWLCSSKGNQDYMLHSRVLGMLAKTGFDLNYIVEIEAGFKPEGRRQFKPDIQLWKSDDLRFVVEYESTNSSDLRVISKDLRHYVESRGNSPSPAFWLVIYTLPDHAVEASDWKFWGLTKSDPCRRSIAKNPHKYYKKLLSKELAQSKIDSNSDWETKKIFFTNLTEEGLEIDFPTRFNKKYRFKSPRSKR
jgi:hypothetical protein